MNVLLNDLSTEILLQIFQFCDILDLCRLQQTCQRFNKIIESYLHLILGNNILVTNQVHEYTKQRSAIVLAVRDKWRVSHYWKIGKYNEKSLLYERENFIPWLNLTSDHVWISRGHYIKAYKRRNNKINAQHPIYVLSSINPSDISRFIKTDNCIISGQCDGGVWIWCQTENKINYNQLCHNSAVNSVDIYNNLFVTGSRDCFFKVWSCEGDLGTCEFVCGHYLHDRIWSTSFNRDGTSLSVGTSGCNLVAPLHVFDTCSFQKRCILGKNFPKGSGILDMKWENSNILLTCGYDSYVRKWDLRTEACEQSWEDPFQSTVYCLETDSLCTLMTGTQSHGRVVLFDTRQTKYIQMYFMQSCKKRGRSSPIYSLSYDATLLFAATDQHLNILDFSDKQAKVRNYSNLYYKEINIHL